MMTGGALLPSLLGVYTLMLTSRGADYYVGFTWDDRAGDSKKVWSPVHGLQYACAWNATVTAVAYGSHVVTGFFTARHDCEDIQYRNRLLSLSVTHCDGTNPAVSMAQHTSLPYVTLAPALCKPNVTETEEHDVCYMTSQWGLQCDVTPPSAALVIAYLISKQKHRDVIIIADDEIGISPLTEDLLSHLADFGVRASLYEFTTGTHIEHVLRMLSSYSEHAHPYVILCSTNVTSSILQKVRKFNLRFLKRKWITYSGASIPDLDHTFADNVAIVTSSVNFTTRLRQYAEVVLQASLDAASNATSVFNDAHIDICQSLVKSDVRADVIRNVKKAVEKMIKTWESAAAYDVYSTACLTSDGRLNIQKLASWNNKAKLDNHGEIFSLSAYGLNNRTFKVSSVEYSFFQKKKYDKNGTMIGWEGLTFQLLDELSKDLNFSYTVVEPPDGEWGILSDYGNWTGMIGQVAAREVDFAAACFSITAAREEVVDFATPFFHEQSVVVIKRPPDTNRMFLYIQPFDWPVWVCTLATIFLTGTTLWLFTRLSPYYDVYSTSGQGQCEGCISLVNSYLLTVAVFLQQGSVWLPVSQSGRITLGCFWFCCIVLVATYTGNLIAFLAVTTVEMPFETLSQLANQRAYSWGTSKGVAMVMLFRDSNIETYMDIHQGMDLVTSYNEGLQRVKKGGYAFITEKSWYQAMSAESVDKTCELAKMREEFFPTSYGYAFQTGSPYTDLFSDKINKMREAGLLHKWIKDWTPKNLHCKGLGPMTQTKIATLSDFQGALYVTIIGLALAVLCLLIELLISILISVRNTMLGDGFEKNGHAFGI